MAQWLEVGLTIWLLLFVFVAYFAAAESAWRDLRGVATLLLRGTESLTVPAPDAPPSDAGAGAARG